MVWLELPSQFLACKVQPGRERLAFCVDCPPPKQKEEQIKPPFTSALERSWTLYGLLSSAFVAGFVGQRHIGGGASPSIQNLRIEGAAVWTKGKIYRGSLGRLEKIFLRNQTTWWKLLWAIAFRFDKTKYTNRKAAKKTSFLWVQWRTGAF